MPADRALDADEDSRPQRGIQSIEVGGRLLLALAGSGRPLALKDLAQAAGMSPPKAHPYLVSFGKLGLVAQDAGSGRYGLGPLAMQLGLISLQQYDPVRLATARLPELARQLGHMVAIAVWGNQGPTIVRTEEPPSPVHVNMRHGTVMSVRGTASGRLFAAWLPPDRVRPALAADPASAKAEAAFQRECAQARREGLAHAVDSALPGISALAAPVFDAAGAMVLSLTVIGPGAMLDTRSDSAAARLLRQVAGELTAQLGGGGGSWLCRLPHTEAHMATNLALDPQLLDQVLELSGEPTKKAAVTLALKEFVARREQKKVAELFGKLDWDSSYDYKAERSRP